MKEERVKIIFKSVFPRFVYAEEGTLSPYLVVVGPFEEGDVVELPKRIAKILVEKNRAEYYEEEPK